MRRNVITLAIFFFLVSAYFASKTKASVGTVELRSKTNEDYRCFAASLIQANNRYDVSINCVNVIFPVQPPQISSYVVWIRPLTGKAPIKLGDLGKGIVRFETPHSFSSMFITLEVNPGVRSPSNNIVMEGAVEPISFLKRETTPTPTPEVKEGETSPSEEQTTDVSQLSTRDKLLLALRRAGIAAVIALVAIVGLIFVVTRSRG